MLVTIAAISSDESFEGDDETTTASDSRKAFFKLDARVGFGADTGLDEDAARVRRASEALVSLGAILKGFQQVEITLSTGRWMPLKLRKARQAILRLVLYPHESELNHLKKNINFYAYARCNQFCR